MTDEINRSFGDPGLQARMAKRRGGIPPDCHAGPRTVQPMPPTSLSPLPKGETMPLFGGAFYISVGTKKAVFAAYRLSILQIATKITISFW